jgi:hypothetical protein
MRQQQQWQQQWQRQQRQQQQQRRFCEFSIRTPRAGVRV